MKNKIDTNEEYIMKKVIIETLKKRKWTILFQTIFLGINIYLLTIPPQIIGRIVDMLYDIENNKQNILNNAYYLIGICIVLLLVRITWKYFETINVRKSERDIKVNLFKRFLKLKLKEIQNIKNGEIMSYFVKDINEIRSTIYRISSHGVRIVFTFIIAIFQMVKNVNMNLTIAVMIPIIIACYSVVKIKKYVEKSFKKSQDRFTEMSEYIQESTDSIRTTKAYSCEGEQLKEFIRKNRKVKQSNNTVEVFSNLLKMSLNICFGMCYSISLLYGSKLVLDGKITVGDLITFNGYIALFVGPVNWLPQLVARFKRAQISYKRLEKVYELELEKVNTKNNLLEDKLEGVKNYSIAVKEKGEDVIFLRKIVAGGTDESYGVHVAKLAGVPQVVSKRANEILKSLERKSILGDKAQEKENKKVATGQLDMYNYKLAELAHELDKVNVNELTPIEALNILVNMKEKIG